MGWIGLAGFVLKAFPVLVVSACPMGAIAQVAVQSVRVEAQAGSDTLAGPTLVVRSAGLNPPGPGFLTRFAVALASGATDQGTASVNASVWAHGNAESGSYTMHADQNITGMSTGLPWPPLSVSLVFFEATVLVGPSGGYVHFSGEPLGQQGDGWSVLREYTIKSGGSVNVLNADSPHSLEPGQHDIKVTSSVASLPTTGEFPPVLQFVETIRFESDIGVPAAEAPGLYQSSPVLPSASVGNANRFESVRSGKWYDPPAVDRFRFEMVSPESLYEHIMGLPAGFGAPFELVIDGVSYGTYTDEDTVNLGELVGGDGVPAFEIRGIAPCVDSEDPLAFPIQLAFTTETATFDMIPLNSVADIDNNGEIGPDDINAFVVSFTDAIPANADIDGDGDEDADDIKAFVDAFIAGCG